MIRQLIAPVIVAAVTLHAAQALAQGAFPAPLPGRAGTANDPAFPPVNGAAPAPAFGAPAPSPAFGNAPVPSSSFGAGPASFPGPGGAPTASFAAPPTQAGPPDSCMREFMPLRQEAERRGHLLKEASDKRQGAEVACKIINSFIEAEVRMIKYVETNSARCGIPPQIAEQLKKGHKGSETMKEKICNAATQAAQRQAPAGPSLSDLLGSATTVPEATVAKKSGGSTFDTLSGNALTQAR